MRKLLGTSAIIAFVSCAPETARQEAAVALPPLKDIVAQVAPDTCPPAAPRDTATENPLWRDPAVSWDEVRTLNTRFFGIAVPAAVGATVHDSGTVTSVQLDSVPECRGCSLSVRMWTDSVGDGVEGHVARIMKEEARIDSINRDPKTTVFEFNNYNGKPRPVVGTGDSAIYLDGGCGDCIDASYFYGYGGRIAEVGFSADYQRDRDRRVCELKRFAESFRWKR